MILSRALIRTKEWWDHKIPLCLFLFFLLQSGPLSGGTVIACFYLILSVSAVANYGHAINELFDRDQDARALRTNIATQLGPNHAWTVAMLSAATALVAAHAAAGAPATLLTLGALCLPTAYSAPPIRLKERMWSGVLADALAAHVYPAAMALVITAQLSSLAITPTVVAASVIWSLMLGVRGILSHQVTSEFADQQAGLRTVVHSFGADGIARLVLCVTFPLEIAAFATIVMLASPPCGLLRHRRGVRVA